MVLTQCNVGHSTELTMICKFIQFSCSPGFVAIFNNNRPIFFSRGSSQPRDQNQVSCMAGRFFITWDTRETPKKLLLTAILNTIATSAPSRGADSRQGGRYIEEVPFWNQIMFERGISLESKCWGSNPRIDLLNLWP